MRCLVTGEVESGEWDEAWVILLLDNVFRSASYLELVELELVEAASVCCELVWGAGRNLGCLGSGIRLACLLHTFNTV